MKKNEKVEKMETSEDICHGSGRVPHLSLEQFKAEIETLTGMANVKLLESRGDAGIDDVAVYAVYAADKGVVIKSGDKDIATGVLKGELAGLFRKIRSAVWSVVEDERGMARKGGVDIWKELDRLLKEANIKLGSSGRLELDKKSDFVVIRHGNIPVASSPRRGNPRAIFDVLRKEVWDWVQEVRATAELRIGYARKAEELRKECEGDEDILGAYRGAPEEHTIRSTLGLPDKGMAKSVVQAAMEAVLKVNTAIRSKLDFASEAVKARDIKLKVKKLTRGLVVSAGDSPAIVTHFPVVANAKTVEEAIAFLRTHIAAVGERQVKFVERVEREVRRADRLERLGNQLKAAEGELVAMAM